MKERKRDKDIVKEAIGDPAFYNDKMVEHKEPMKAVMDRKKRGRSKNGL